MTRADALIDLLAAVEDGELPSQTLMDAIAVLFGDRPAILLAAALSGRLEAEGAAIAFVQAVLPYWAWNISSNGEAYVFNDRIGLFEGDVEDNPARARLIAALNAMIAQ